MNPISYFFWLADQASGGLTYIWQVTACIVVSCLISLIYVIKIRNEILLNQLKFIPLPIVGTLLILLVGVLFEKKEAFVFTTYLGVAVTIILIGLSIFKSKRAWPISVSSSAFILWFSFWCWFVSTMSITGDWL